ncbi:MULTISPECIES: hypothetical protein [unclassified Pseudomonas]|uniref:hypothetical protein n=1 Tax=unclassified Pseudomonas TaxID=196821 RepID=UPI0024499905|nr:MULTISPECIES: hypothetical protein [unclassified Pseudomonas]MDG9924449.1 hypothetical protein [Pseudomonas sp. GD04045]MDH0035211.1 hypothetical protein [Pseudomonas sp. GD04019]
MAVIRRAKPSQLFERAFITMLWRELMEGDGRFYFNVQALGKCQNGRSSSSWSIDVQTLSYLSHTGDDVPIWKQNGLYAQAMLFVQKTIRVV